MVDEEKYNEIRERIDNLTDKINEIINCLRENAIYHKIPIEFVDKLEDEGDEKDKDVEEEDEDDEEEEEEAEDEAEE